MSKVVAGRYKPIDALIDYLKGDKPYDHPTGFKLWQVLKFISDELVSLDASVNSATPTTISLGGTGSAIGFQYGTFLPSLQFGGASVGIVYASQFGYYRIQTTNLQSWISGYGGFVLSSKGTSTGNATISVPMINNFDHPVVSVAPRTIFGPTIGAIFGYIVPGTSYFSLWYLNAGTAVTVTDTTFVGNSEFYFRFEYRLS